MKIALITDTHFGARNDSLAFNEYFYKFWEDVFFPYIKENNIDTVIHLGDVMDRRKFVSYKISSDFRKRFVKPFVDMGINLHIMVGNHDTYWKNTNEINSVDELLGDRHSNIHMYSEAETVEFDGLPIHFIPWINAENYQSTIDGIKNTKADMAMGHLEINGFEMHAGHFSESGYPAQMFRKFDSVFSGHFHKKSDDGHIYYLGNTYQMTWSDDNCPKGFHVFDTSTREIERIINPYTIFKKIYYDDTSRDWSKEDVEQYAGKFIKLIVVNKKDLYQFDRFVDRLLSVQTHEVKIVEDFSDLDASNVSDEIMENAEDTTTLLERYVDELDVDLNKDRLKSTMKSLYLEASDLEL
jgi:DNA repair exonuclease SbcCD nuclease subunit|tara:strand:- start:2226 stop:3287 length:1062 start_codon:yes stop_codon:yes gene_type:complete